MGLFRPVAGQLYFFAFTLSYITVPERDDTHRRQRGLSAEADGRNRLHSVPGRRSTSEIYDWGLDSSRGSSSVIPALLKS